MSTVSAMSSDQPPYRQAALPVEQRLADLLGRMSLAEKIDQLHQCGVGDTNPNNLKTRSDEFRPTYGSFILNGPPDLALRNELQRRAVAESRLGIPAIFGADVIHGYRTIAPIPLAQACAWEPALVRRAAALAAAESHAQGVDWTFAPMVDHCVDPRWGRVAETFGESPFAASVFAVASVEGFQNGPVPIAACLKHYVGYGASEGGRDYSSTEIAPQRLWEMHLPPFEAGIRAGAKSVMSAFNDLNGVPTSANHYTLTEILRDRWGFKGLVVSDWNATLQLLNQGYAADEADAAQKSLLAGVDLDMADGFYRKHLAALVADGRVPVAAIDEAVRRVLRVKFELGLFEHPFIENAGPATAAPTAAQREQVAEFATRSMVLLKNNGALPLASAARRLAHIGPLADDGAALLGSWAGLGRPDETTTIAAGLRARLPADVKLEILPGCAVEGDDRSGFAAAVALAEKSDTVILCLGEAPWMSGENASRSSLRLPGVQQELALAVAAATAGKPLILLLVSGRPLEIAAIEPHVAAILAVWQPGTEGGAAVADLLLGHKNPSGRLAQTWPRTTGQIPIYHNMRPRARTGRDGVYQDVDTTPLYEFGHGLSYTTFAYSPIRLTKKSEGRAGPLGPPEPVSTPAPQPGAPSGRALPSTASNAATVATNEKLVAEITVTNSGTRDGIETALWFIRDPVASITRPLRDLKHFETAPIAAGTSRVFRFEIDPSRDLSFPDADGRRILEPGEIILTAGDQSATFQVVTEKETANGRQ